MEKIIDGLPLLGRINLESFPEIGAKIPHRVRVRFRDSTRQFLVLVFYSEDEATRRGFIPLDSGRDRIVPFSSYEKVEGEEGTRAAEFQLGDKEIPEIVWPCAFAITGEHWGKMEEVYGYRFRTRAFGINTSAPVFNCLRKPSGFTTTVPYLEGIC